LNKEISLPKNISYTQEISLSHDQNFITIEYGVTNLINHEECIYKYRLEGVDAEWVNAGTRSFVNYSGLKPGTYIFNLQSSNSNGVWSAITKLKFIITPAWWQTGWFIFLVFISVAALIIKLYINKIRQIRYHATIKHQITESEMAALKAQMNPHFMFNCINSIDAFIQTNDKYHATVYLNKFAKLLRNILESSKQNTVSLGKDVETLKLYVELEEMRHEKKFTTSFVIEDDLLQHDYKVPPLIIQPFVENAILHGLKNKSGNDGLLVIAIRRVGEFLQFTITDNGIGRVAAGKFMQNKTSHYGMQMSTDRIKLFNKEKSASVIIKDLVEQEQPVGTTVTVKLKIK
jgi:hypothetical protein